jgi:hypothetical protein
VVCGSQSNTAGQAEVIGQRSNPHTPWALQSRWCRAACWTWCGRTSAACLLGARARNPAANACFGTHYQVPVLAYRILVGRAVAPTTDEGMIVRAGFETGSSYLKEQAQMRAGPAASMRALQQHAKDLTGWYLYLLATVDCAVPKLQARSAVDKEACIQGTEALFVVPHRRNCSEDFPEFRWQTVFEYAVTQHQQDHPPAESGCCAVEQPIVTSERPVAPEEIGTAGTSGRANCPWQQSNRPH